MATNNAPSAGVPLKYRFWVRASALFVGTFLAVFMLFFVYDLFASIGESRALDTDPAAQAPPVVIDPRIETDLAKVLAFDVVDNAVDIRDPFIDRARLSNTVGAAGTVQQASAGTAGTSGTTATALNSSTGGVTRTITGTAGPATENVVIPTSKDRYTIWEDRVRSGYDAGPVSVAFTVDDLVPVGYASGGSGQEEVMFYSMSLCRTFSFPVGTRFFDGWLSSLSQQEVVFSLDDRSRILTKSYSTPTKCTGT